MRKSWLLLTILILIVLLFSVADSQSCIYDVNVKTGDVSDAGTDSTISLIMSDAQGTSVVALDLDTWGIMAPSHNYFERGNLDLFRGRGKCLQPRICHVQLTSDNSGIKPGWYLEYVEVHQRNDENELASSNEYFPFNQWFALDEKPHSLSAEIDRCRRTDVKETETSASIA